jgi:hypothetical protein
MSEKILSEISHKLNVVIAMSLRQVMGDKDFSTKARRRHGTGDVVRYLANMGLNAKDIAAIVGAPVQSVRTLLTPTRRR